VTCLLQNAHSGHGGGGFCCFPYYSEAQSFIVPQFKILTLLTFIFSDFGVKISFIEDFNHFNVQIRSTDLHTNIKRGGHSQ
jgi:hypothetical protein